MALPRVFISTDIRLSSGTEKDDVQSLVHALMYQDKMNIVGISATASKYTAKNALVGNIDKVIDVYGRDHAKLEAHSSAFKSAAELKAISWQGAISTAPSVGHSGATDGSRAIITEAKKAAAVGEKLNVLTWGGETDLAQALHDDPSIAPHVRFFNINDQDPHAYEYIAETFKGELDLWVDNQSTYRGMYQTPTSTSIIPDWHQDHVKGHGALGDYFAQMSADIFGKSGIKMGDSPTVLRFLNGNQNDPAQESWGGEFIKVSDRYYVDATSDSLDLNRSGTDGAWTVYEDRAAWLNSFAERFDWLKGGAPDPDDGDDGGAPPPPTVGNLLANGSFESASVATGQYATYQSLSGWTALSGGRIEVWNAHKGVRAIDGSDFVELDHAGALDGFYQDVATKAGQAYSLSFDLMARPGHAASTQGVEVVWNGRVVATASPGSGWGTFTVDVTGTGGRDRLTIREVGSQSKDGHGALLDDFALVAKGAAKTSDKISDTGSGGTGPDVVTVKVSGDAHKGDPDFALLVNGRMMDASTLVTADRAEGEWDTIVFRGDFDLDGSDRVGVRFNNDLCDRGADGRITGDRNLHVDAVTVNGETNGTDRSLWSAGTAYWDV